MAQIAHDMFFLLVLTVLLKVFSAVYRITGSTLETLKAVFAPDPAGALSFVGTCSGQCDGGRVL